MADGSCLCGTVKWRTTGMLETLSHCHCSQCRKAHGAAFASYTATAPDRFQWLAGTDAIRHYNSSGEINRAFCGTCGGVVPEDAPGGKEIYIPAGSFDDDPELRGGYHIFVGSKAPWHEIADDLPQHEFYPAGSQDAAQLPVVEPAALTAPTPGVARGSCLCGDIAFTVELPFKFIHNCHCTRCRKARAAAHTTNGFVAKDKVVFQRGQDQIVTYKRPDAKYFTHCFCARCGSGMPRLDPDRNIAVIPLGSLDDSPNQRPDDHIFVGSKAPWYEIADDLPQFTAMPTK